MNTNASIKIGAALIAATIVSSCGGTDEGPLLTGVFLDSPVTGLRYVTPTVTGVTTTAGEFNYRAGEVVTFSVGGLALPMVVAAEIVTPLDMMFDDDEITAEVVNVLRFLQSLDEDADPSNGIVIAEDVTEVFANKEVFDVTSDTAVASAVERAFNGGRGVVSATAAEAHFVETLSTNAVSEATLGQFQYLVPLDESNSVDTLFFDGGMYELNRDGVSDTGNVTVQSGVYQLHSEGESLFISLTEDEYVLACIAKYPRPVFDCDEEVFRVFEDEQQALAFAGLDALETGAAIESGSQASSDNTLEVDFDLGNNEIEENLVARLTDEEMGAAASVAEEPIEEAPLAENTVNQSPDSLEPDMESDVETVSVEQAGESEEVFAASAAEITPQTDMFALISEVTEEIAQSVSAVDSLATEESGTPERNVSDSVTMLIEPEGSVALPIESTDMVAAISTQQSELLPVRPQPASINVVSLEESPVTESKPVAEQVITSRIDVAAEVITEQIELTSTVVGVPVVPETNVSDTATPLIKPEVNVTVPNVTVPIESTEFVTNVSTQQLASVVPRPSASYDSEGSPVTESKPVAEQVSASPIDMASEAIAEQIELGPSVVHQLVTPDTNVPEEARPLEIPTVLAPVDMVAAEQVVVVEAPAVELPESMSVTANAPEVQTPQPIVVERSAVVEQSVVVEQIEPTFVGTETEVVVPDVMAVAEIPAITESESTLNILPIEMIPVELPSNEFNISNTIAVNLVEEPQLNSPGEVEPLFLVEQPVSIQPSDITDLIVLTGQTNATARETAFDAVLDASNERVFAFVDDGSWQEADLHQNWDENLPGNFSLDNPNRQPFNNLAFQLGKVLVEPSDRVVGIIMVTAPGEGISHWDYESSFYRKIRSRVTAALSALPQKNTIDAMIWVQGETDWLFEGSADSGATGFSSNDTEFYRNYYPNKLLQLISNLRSEVWFAGQAQFICAETKKAELNPHLMALNADSDQLTGCAQASDLATRPGDPFNNQFSAASLRTLASRIADLYLGQ